MIHTSGSHVHGRSSLGHSTVQLEDRSLQCYAWRTSDFALRSTSSSVPVLNRLHGASLGPSAAVQNGSVQFNAVSTSLGKLVCASPRLSQVFHWVGFETVQVLVFRWPCFVLSRQIINHGLFLRQFLSFLQAVDGVMPLVWCQQIVYQVHQHVRSFETQAISK